MATDRRTFLKYAAGGGGAAAASQAASGARCATQPGPANPLNLLLALPDEMRAHAQRFMQADPGRTPRIDRFAQEAAAMRQAVANYHAAWWPSAAVNNRSATSCTTRRAPLTFSPISRRTTGS